MGVNKFSVETQTDMFRDGKGDKISQKDIEEVRAYIAEQRTKTPSDELERCFQSWEAEVKKLIEAHDTEKAKVQMQATEDRQALDAKIATLITIPRAGDATGEKSDTALKLSEDASVDKKALLSSLSKKDIVLSCHAGVEYNKHPETVKTLQKLLEVPETGKYDKTTRVKVAALQKMLKKEGFYVSAIDTVFGPATYAAYNEYLNHKQASKLHIPACNTQCAPGTRVKKPKTEGRVKGSGIPEKQEKDSGETLERFILSPVARGTEEKIPTGSKVDILNDSKTSVFFKDGAYYLTGPKGRPTRVEFQKIAQAMHLSENAPENLQKSVEIVNDVSEVLDAYLLKFPKNKSNYDAALKLVKGDFNNPSILNGTAILNVNRVINILLKDSKLVGIFYMPDSKARHYAVLQFVRKDLDQSDIVANSIISRNGNKFGMDDTKIMTGDISGIELTPSQKQKVEKKIDEAKIEAAKNWSSHKDEYIAAFKRENPGVDTTQLGTQAEEWNKKLTVLAMTKREIFYQKLHDASYNDPELDILKDILGAGTFKMSDRAWDMTGEASKIIGMEAIALAVGMVTAGVGTMAINAAILGRNTYRGAKAIEAYNAASKTRKYSTAAGRILGSGAGFEAGAATTRSLFENGDLTSMHSKEGYAQSIAMMGVLGGIGKLIQSGKFGTQILHSKAGDGVIKGTLRFSGQVAIDGLAIFGTTGIVGTLMVDGQDNWTPEQLAQAMLMATLFKGAGRLHATKKPGGEIEVKPEQSTHSRSNTVDTTAQTRINEEHGIGRTPVDHGYGTEQQQSTYSRSNTVDTTAQTRINEEHGIGRTPVDHGYGTTSVSELSTKPIEMYKSLELQNPKRGDIIRVGDREYRYTAMGERWQSLERGETWALKDYATGPYKTNTELRTQVETSLRLSESELGLKNTKEFNHANLNDRALFRKSIDGAIRGDRLEIGDNQYRRVNNRWQKLPKDDLLAAKDYTEGQFRTNEQVMADWNLNNGKVEFFPKNTTAGEIAAIRSLDESARNKGKELDVKINDRAKQKEVQSLSIVDRNILANDLSKNRYTSRDGNVGTGKITVGGKEMNLSNASYDGLRNEYSEALKISDDAELRKIDTRFAERLILDSGSRMELANAQEARVMVEGLGNVAPYKGNLRSTEIDGIYYVSMN